MNKFLMVLAAGGLSVALGATAAMAAPPPAGQKTTCTGKDCNKALNATHHGVKGNKNASKKTAEHKSRKVRHNAHPTASHHTAEQHRTDQKPNKD